MLAQTVRVFVACVVALACLAAAGMFPVHAADKGMRTWTDIKGKFKIEAKLLSVENGVVTLEKEDGSELEIELKKLSTADQKFATEAAKDDSDNPFKSKADDPFKPKSKGSKPGGQKKSSGGMTSGPAERANEPVRVKVNLSAADRINLGAPTEAWQVEASEPAESGNFKARTAPLSPKSGFFEKLKGIAVNLEAKKAAVGFHIAEPKPAGATRVVICDLATGKSSPAAAAPGQMVPLALHDDGRQILMRSEEFGFGKLDRLEIWTTKGAKAQKTIEWIPYDDVQGGARDVLWAEFVDAETLATSSRAGKVVVWKFPEIEPMCVFDLVDGAVPALSPDRRLIAFSNGKEIGLFDVAKREVLAQQSTPDKLQWPAMAFSPSGKRLACVAFDKVLVWDVASGKLERTIPAAGLSLHGAIDFAADNFLLANGKFLIDLDHQLKLWTYEGHEDVRSAGGWTFFGTTSGEKKPGALVAVRVPHPAAADLLEKALTDPTLFVLKAGTTVKLNVTGIPDASQHARVLDSLARRLAAIGCKAGANGTIELQATIEGPKEQIVSFIGAGGHKMQEYVTRIRFVFQGQSAWEATASNVPGVLSLKRGEDLATALREREKPDYGFFERAELPKFLQKPLAGQGANRSLTLGRSQVTVQGIR